MPPAEAYLQKCVPCYCSLRITNKKPKLNHWKNTINLILKYSSVLKTLAKKRNMKPVTSFRNFELLKSPVKGCSYLPFSTNSDPAQNSREANEPCDWNESAAEIRKFKSPKNRHMYHQSELGHKFGQASTLRRWSIDHFAVSTWLSTHVHSDKSPLSRNWCSFARSKRSLVSSPRLSASSAIIHNSK